MNDPIKQKAMEIQDPVEMLNYLKKLSKINYKMDSEIYRHANEVFKSANVNEDPNICEDPPAAFRKRKT